MHVIESTGILNLYYTALCFHHYQYLYVFFIRSLRERRLQYEKVIEGRDYDVPELRSSFTRRALRHGSINEANGLATLCCKILPAFFPNLTLHEEGCVMLERNGEAFMIVSPDGCARDDETGKMRLAVEVKCPMTRIHYMSPQSSESEDSDVAYHDLVPVRHVCQILSEMAALDCSHLLFVCYHPGDATTVFLARFDPELWEVLFAHAGELWGGKQTQPPTQQHPDTEMINAMLERYCYEKIEVLAEVPSLTSINTAINISEELWKCLVV